MCFGEKIRGDSNFGKSKIMNLGLELCWQVFLLKMTRVVESKGISPNHRW